MKRKKLLLQMTKIMERKKMKKKKRIPNYLLSTRKLQGLQKSGIQLKCGKLKPQLLLKRWKRKRKHIKAGIVEVYTSQQSTYSQNPLKSQCSEHQ
jgi:hypothetical protein